MNPHIFVPADIILCFLKIFEIFIVSAWHCYATSRLMYLKSRTIMTICCLVSFSNNKIIQKMGMCKQR